MLMLICLTNAYNLQRNTANITHFEFCYCIRENLLLVYSSDYAYAPFFWKLLEGGSQCISFSGIRNFAHLI